MGLIDTYQRKQAEAMQDQVGITVCVWWGGGWALAGGLA